MNEGYFKYGEWLLIWVELNNQGPDLQASLEVRVSGSYGTVVTSTPVELPAGAHKKVPIYVLANNFSRQLEVQLLSEEKLITQDKVAVHPQLNNTYFIGLLAESRGALAQINGAKIPSNQPRQLIMVNLNLAELPEKAPALNSLDALIINDLDTSPLNAGQLNALESWVRRGGKLVIGGGAGAQKSLAGLTGELAPFIASDLEQLDQLNDLVRFSAGQQTEEVQEPAEEKPIRVPGPFLVSTGSNLGSQVLAQEAGLPILLEKKIGNGAVFFSALDLSLSPFDAWNGTTGFWENLLSPGANFPAWLPSDTSSRQQLTGPMPYTLTNLPMLDLPSIRLLAFWLVLYILLIGPVNYLVLRWKKRLHLAWITIPAITLVFSIGAFGLGYALHGTDVFVNKISIIELIPEGKAQATGFIGIFSPAQRGYEVEVFGNGLVSAMGPFYDPWDSSGQAGVTSTRELKLIQGDPAIVKGLSIEQWSMQSFMVEGVSVDVSDIRGSLELQNQALIGSLKNTSGQKIQDALVLVNKSFYRLGDLEAGQEAPLDFSISDQTDFGSGTSISWMIYPDQMVQPNPSSQTARVAEVRRQIIEALFDRTPSFQFSSTKNNPTGSGIISTPVFIGWITESPPRIRVRNAEPGEQTTAVLVQLLQFALPTGQVVIPTGWIPGTLVQSPIDSGPCGDAGSTSVYLIRGSATFNFSIPKQFSSIDPEKIRLSLWSDSEIFQNFPELAIYDWTSQTWSSLSGFQKGVNLIPQARQYIDQDGIVQVRMNSADNSPGCYFLAMGLEGVNP